MHIDRVENVFRRPTPENIQAILDDEEMVFWVDWRQADETVADECDRVLKTGELKGELAEVESEQGYEVYFQYKTRRVKLPLTYSPGDRHIAILSLNEVLKPEYEVRFCIASMGSDSAAFLPLASDVWKRLEGEFGAAVHQQFYVVSDHPNLFTEATVETFEKLLSPLKKVKPWWKFW